MPAKITNNTNMAKEDPFFIPGDQEENPDIGISSDDSSELDYEIKKKPIKEKPNKAKRSTIRTSDVEESVKEKTTMKKSKNELADSSDEEDKVVKKVIKKKVAKKVAQELADSSDEEDKVVKKKVIKKKVIKKKVVKEVAQELADSSDEEDKVVKKNELADSSDEEDKVVKKNELADSSDEEDIVPEKKVVKKVEPEKLADSSDEEDKVPEKKVKKKVVKKVVPKKLADSSDEEDKVPEKKVKKKVVKKVVPKKLADSSDDELVDSSDEEDIVPEKKSAKKKVPKKEVVNSSDDEDVILPKKKNMKILPKMNNVTINIDGSVSVEHLNGKCNLFPNQKDAFMESKDALTRWSTMINTSVLGAGKTYMVNASACWLGVPVIILGPTQTRGVWEKVVKLDGNQCIKFMTYSSLAGTKNHQPKHPYLSRVDRYGKGTDFYPTPAYRELVKNGLVLICDEVHAGKNNSTYHASIKALTGVIHEQFVNQPSLDHNRSRVILISGSPYEKREMTVRYIQMMGLGDSERVYLSGDMLDGVHIADSKCLAGQLIRTCLKFDRENTLTLLRDSPLDTRGDAAITVMYKLYIEIIKPFLIISMQPFVLETPPDIKNGLYEVSEDEEVTLSRYISAMQNVNDNKSGEYNNYIRKRSMLITMLQKIEHAKLNIFAREATYILENNPGEKVAIFLGFNKNILRLTKLLQKFHPVCVTGLLPKQSDREDAVRRFQEKKKYNLIICNKKAGGSSISLHGPETRHQLISPAFDVLEQYQSSGRCIRQGGTGKVILRYVYADIEAKESRLLNNIASKSKVMEDLLDKQRSMGFLLPSEFENEKISMKNVEFSDYDPEEVDEWIEIMSSRYEKQSIAAKKRSDAKIVKEEAKANAKAKDLM